MMNRDVVVIGASVGGVELVLSLVKDLPADLPASLFVAIHSYPYSRNALPELLSSRGVLPASHAIHGEQIVPGHIYVAPPDNHLLVRRGTVDVVRGPKENGHRPAVDALFRSASAAYGPRVIAVVLSGYQDCGTAGMMSIRARGGVSVVQSPESAQADEMPRNVIDRVPVDHIVNPAELPELLNRLVRSAPGPAPQPDPLIDQIEGRTPGAPVEVGCPLCSGVLTEASNGNLHHFRCHVGHTFSLQGLVREQNEQMERALWAAVRALEESAALSLRLSVSETSDLRSRFGEKAKTERQQADLIREILLHGPSLVADSN
jgi:two-component system chemotaxis response regulator CheB